MPGGWGKVAHRDRKDNEDYGETREAHRTCSNDKPFAWADQER